MHTPFFNEGSLTLAIKDEWICRKRTNEYSLSKTLKFTLSFNTVCHDHGHDQSTIDCSLRLWFTVYLTVRVNKAVSTLTEHFQFTLICQFS